MAEEMERNGIEELVDEVVGWGRGGVWEMEVMPGPLGQNSLHKNTRANSCRLFHMRCLYVACLSLRGTH
jgi:hypothetical protein